MEFLNVDDDMKSKIAVADKLTEMRFKRRKYYSSLHKASNKDLSANTLHQHRLEAHHHYMAKDMAAHGDRESSADKVHTSNNLAYPGWPPAGSVTGPDGVATLDGIDIITHCKITTYDIHILYRSSLHLYAPSSSV